MIHDWGNEVLDDTIEGPSKQKEADDDDDDDGSDRIEGKVDQGNAFDDAHNWGDGVVGVSKKGGFYSTAFTTVPSGCCFCALHVFSLSVYACRI